MELKKIDTGKPFLKSTIYQIIENQQLNDFSHELNDFPLEYAIKNASDHFVKKLLLHGAKPTSWETIKKTFEKQYFLSFCSMMRSFPELVSKATTTELKEMMLSCAYCTSEHVQMAIILLETQQLKVDNASLYKCGVVYSMRKRIIETFYVHNLPNVLSLANQIVKNTIYGHSSADFQLFLERLSKADLNKTFQFTKGLYDACLKHIVKNSCYEELHKELRNREMELIRILMENGFLPNACNPRKAHGYKTSPLFKAMKLKLFDVSEVMLHNEEVSRDVALIIELMKDATRRCCISTCSVLVPFISVLLNNNVMTKGEFINNTVHEAIYDENIPYSMFEFWVDKFPWLTDAEKCGGWYILLDACFRNDFFESLLKKGLDPCVKGKLFYGSALQSPLEHCLLKNQLLPVLFEKVIPSVSYVNRITQNYDVVELVHTALLSKCNQDVLLLLLLQRRRNVDVFGSSYLPLDMFKAIMRFCDIPFILPRVGENIKIVEPEEELSDAEEIRPSRKRKVEME